MKKIIKHAYNTDKWIRLYILSFNLKEQLPLLLQNVNEVKQSMLVFAASRNNLTLQFCYLSLQAGDFGRNNHCCN